MSKDLCAPSIGTLGSMEQHGNSRLPDLTELRMFCAAADLGTFGRAAVRCQVSQPAISKRIAGLESLAGVKLLDRSSKGVTLTSPGRRVYEEARRLLEQAQTLDSLFLGFQRHGAPVRLALSHSSSEAFAGSELSDSLGPTHKPIELLTANSEIVRNIVSEGRADLGIVASRPGHTPYAGVSEVPLADDEVICGVPPGHPWAKRKTPISIKTFLSTPIVVRDPSSNARWTVDAVLKDQGLEPHQILTEVSTPSAARAAAVEAGAPVLLSRIVLHGHRFSEVPIKGLRFLRSYSFVLPALGEPSDEVKELMDRLRVSAAKSLHP